MRRSRPSRSPLCARGRVRAVALCVLAACLLFDGTANAAANTQRCRRLSRQIDQYLGVAKMAGDRGDGLWFEGTMNHVQRLSDRRKKMCPEFDQPSQAEVMAAWMKKMTKAAAKTFIKYLTFGIY